MSDARSILKLYDHARANDLPVVLATVVRTAGSTYRKPGARMMLCADGSRVGVVSGGCLEGDVTRRAWFLKHAGARELVRYDTGSGDDATYEFGLGCRGIVDIVVERLDLSSDPEVIGLLRQSVDSRASGLLRIDLGSMPCANAEPIAVRELAYEEQITPPVQLVVFGSGADAPPLVRIAEELGWSVAVVDHKLSHTRTADGTKYIAAAPSQWTRNVKVDAQTACVLMTHRMKDDAGYLADVTASNCGYIGCLGPISRTEALIDELALAGILLSDVVRQRIHAPVGLDLGAERPQDIALAIIAEIAAVMNGASGGSLRMREGPIHDVKSVMTTP
jgi:xanthine/CO dehydrogenase XdhC/CoxF family maturation factor